MTPQEFMKEYGFEEEEIEFIDETIESKEQYEEKYKGCFGSVDNGKFCVFYTDQTFTKGKMYRIKEGIDID